MGPITNAETSNTYAKSPLEGHLLGLVEGLAALGAMQRLSADQLELLALDERLPSDLVDRISRLSGYQAALVETAKELITAPRAESSTTS